MAGFASNALERRASWDAVIVRWRAGNDAARADGWRIVERRVAKILGAYTGDFSWESKLRLEWIGDEVLAWQNWADCAVKRGVTINIWSAQFQTWVRAAAARSDSRWNRKGLYSAEDLEDIFLERQFFIKWCEDRKKTYSDDGLTQLIAKEVKNPDYACWLTWRLEGFDYNEIAARHTPPLKLATIRSGVKRAMDAVLVSAAVREYLTS